MRPFSTDMLSAAASIGLTAVCVAMAAPAVAATTPAATDHDAPRRAIVRVTDADLSTPAGRSAVDARIHAAAMRVCTLDERGLRTDGDCVKAAIATARAVPAAPVQIAAR